MSDTNDDSIGNGNAMGNKFIATSQICNHDICMREARAREFALGIGKGDGICSRHGAMIEVVRKNCSHERCTDIAIKGDYCENHSKMKKNGNKGKRKSESDLQRELDHFTAENIHNLDHFKQAYRNHQNASTSLNTGIGGSHIKKSKLMKLLAIIRENKEFASKQKKIINLESAIRRKRHQEVGYCRDERCRRNYCREERRKEIKMKAEAEAKEKIRQYHEQKPMRLEEEKRKYWRCPHGCGLCHKSLEDIYKHLGSTSKLPCEEILCGTCKAIEWEEYHARTNGMESLKGSKPNLQLTWHCYRMLTPDTPKKRRVVLGVLKEGKKIVAWPDWRDDMTPFLVQPQQTEKLAMIRTKLLYETIDGETPRTPLKLFGICPCPNYYSEWQKAGELDHLEFGGRTYCAKHFCNGIQCPWGH